MIASKYKICLYNRIENYVSICSDALCQEPSLESGMHIGDHNGPMYARGETINAVCQPGYMLEGPITRTCLGNNIWTGVNPVCIQGQFNCNNALNLIMSYGEY